MDVFPTQYSVLSAQAIGTFLSEKYDLGETSCKLLIHNVSDTYTVENASSRYIFKIYRDSHRKLPEIKGEIELLNILKQNGANVSFPIMDRYGEQIQKFNAAEGIHYGVLLSFAEGRVVYDMNDEQLKVLGREMAAIHNITAGLELGFPRKHYDLATTIIQPLAGIEPAFANLKAEFQYLTDAAERVTKALNNFDLLAFGYGYCHYDFLPKNFHFAEDNSITFFDFDFAGEGYLANDITSFYIHYFLEVVGGKISRTEAERCFSVFIESYRQIRNISQQETEAIGCLGFAFWIFYFGFHYENFDDWSNFFFNDKFIQSRVALIKKWIDWFEI